jgi:hypothetical protein
MNAPFPISTTTSAGVDARRSLLARASARHALVEAGEMDLDTAFSELVGPFLSIVFPHPKSNADGYWDNPGWRNAAIEYYRNRKRRR